jgi:hypothetical protein
VGNDGMVGIYSLIEGAVEPAVNAIGQMPGSGLLLPGTIIRHEMRQSAEVQDLMLRYLHSNLAQMAQSTVCNRFHTIEQRMCRWLLQCADLVPNGPVTMTHTGMANMMGVRRERVSEVLMELEKQDLVTRSRKLLRIKNLERVASTSCECYEIIKASTRSLMVPKGLQRQTGK